MKTYEAIEEKTGIIQFLIEIEKQHLEKPTLITVLIHSTIKKTKMYKIVQNVKNELEEKQKKLREWTCDNK